MSAKNLDKHNRFRSITVGFRVSPEEHEHITPQRMEETILKLLENWMKKRQRDQQRYAGKSNAIKYRYNK